MLHTRCFINAYSSRYLAVVKIHVSFPNLCVDNSKMWCWMLSRVATVSFKCVRQPEREQSSMQQCLVCPSVVRTLHVAEVLYMRLVHPSACASSSKDILGRQSRSLLGTSVRTTLLQPSVPRDILHIHDIIFFSARRFSSGTSGV